MVKLHDVISGWSVLPFFISKYTITKNKGDGKNMIVHQEQEC
jgi:hypothetical protein